MPSTKVLSMGDRAFSAAVPRLWNDLPQRILASNTIKSFGKSQKLVLKKAYKTGSYA